MHHFDRTQCKQKGNAVAIILLLVAAVATGYFLISKDIIKNPFQSSSSNSNLGSQIFEKTQNPLEGKLPETNPFAEVQTNPFKNIYPNPFDRTSK